MQPGERNVASCRLRGGKGARSIQLDRIEPHRKAESTRNPTGIQEAEDTPTHGISGQDDSGWRRE